jgi:hypothetical protein
MLKSRISRLENQSTGDDVLTVIVQRFSDAPLPDTHQIKTVTSQTMTVHYRKVPTP